MTLLDDIKAKQAQVLSELTTDDGLISSLTTALSSKDDQLAHLNTELQAAIATQNAAGNDTAAFQPISDAMDGLVSESAAQNAALVAAVQANITPPAGTNPAPTTTPAPVSTGPVITSISPTSSAAGDQIAITGTNLAGLEAVNFGNVAVDMTQIAVSADGTTATALVPPGTGSTTVTVATAAGTSNGVAFSYGASSGNLSPAAAPAV